MAIRHIVAALVPCLACLAVAAPLRAGTAVYAPGSTVEGKSLPRWTEEWWQKTFSVPVYAADGKTIINPQFDEPLNTGDVVAAHSAPAANRIAPTTRKWTSGSRTSLPIMLIVPCVTSARTRAAPST